MGHYCYKLPQSIAQRQYLEDVYPPSRDNLCLFRCIVKQFRPQENLQDREKRVKLMWAIFKVSSFQNVDSESVIKDHRQVICENELEYLYNLIEEYRIS